MAVTYINHTAASTIVGDIRKLRNAGSGKIYVCSPDYVRRFLG